jgi:hypothetical protein
VRCFTSGQYYRKRINKGNLHDKGYSVTAKKILSGGVMQLEAEGGQL